MDILTQILNLKDDAQAQNLSRFFKTGKGQYGYGDKFLGIKVPQTRELVKKFYGQVSVEELEKLLHNEYHEVRLFALLSLVAIFEKQKDKRELIFDLYLKNTEYINNWDLVDLSAPKIVGRYCFEQQDDSKIFELADTKHLWSERIAIVSQWYSIKKGQYKTIQKLAKKFLTHKHDLIHKSTGWMLRELGKMDEKILCDFLDKYSKKMPRTMLRYAIEKFDKEKKEKYM